MIYMSSDSSSQGEKPSTNVSELARSDRDLSINMVGLGLAIFTFLLFFLDHRVSSGVIDPILFQVTLTVIVVVMFSFCVSALDNYALVRPAPVKRTKVPPYRQRAQLFFTFGLLMLLLEPTLILFTLRLDAIGLASLALFMVFLTMYIHEHLRAIERSRAAPRISNLSLLVESIPLPILNLDSITRHEVLEISLCDSCEPILPAHSMRTLARIWSSGYLEESRPGSLNLAEIDSLFGVL